MKFSDNKLPFQKQALSLEPFYDILLKNSFFCRFLFFAGTCFLNFLFYIKHHTFYSRSSFLESSFLSNMIFSLQSPSFFGKPSSYGRLFSRPQFFWNPFFRKLFFIRTIYSLNFISHFHNYQQRFFKNLNLFGNLIFSKTIFRKLILLNSSSSRQFGFFPEGLFF